MLKNSIKLIISRVTNAKTRFIYNYLYTDRSSKILRQLGDILDKNPNKKITNLINNKERIAQLVEHWTFNPQALGSNPSTLI